MSQNTEQMPVSLYRAAQVRELDRRLIAAGTPGVVLMQRAAHAAWRTLRRHWPTVGCVTVLAGQGNNAGDGYLLAVLAQRAGWRVKVLAVGDPRRLRGDAAAAAEEARVAGVVCQDWRNTSSLDGVLVDALLGTGLSGDVRAPYIDAISAINASGRPVLALDVPSGLCADTGRALGLAVKASVTVTFIGMKIGLLTGEGPALAGECVFDDLQADPAILEQVPAAAQRLASVTLQALPARSPTAHKGRFGHLLVLGGDRGTGGAALLSAEAALRCGAGMVSLATRPEHIAAALARRPEIMTLGVDSTYRLHALGEVADVLVAGPGLGVAPWGRALLSLAASRAVPQLWDADALNLLAEGLLQLPAGAVITPHPGEAGRLLGWSTAEVQADRPRAVLALAQRYNCVALLKGAGTLIADAQGRLALCDHGHPAMAGPGLGDVLAGVIGALLAQGLSPFDAASLGCWLHARAGERLGREGRGLAASELIPLVRRLLEEHSPCLS
ncbi:NAD(P)H-hydrate dehydratase [Stutzerimonas kirkiae]|uniref:NAD(P)H-hydrate dehydratase n=1 Tax=Stutzerimonas kirkiae TaxID=2211392 RepID=UPI001038549D|nr:NAD(P)H-hydrate dehydratase [Stutzerimonas kirkiae]TBV10456.1 bifunctional ADP-dependent NAD(P)H-hydrate dehydratase/NAD(P)H-hydrate epimerase [Stutzerimonas kirkiae]